MNSQKKKPLKIRIYCAGGCGKYIDIKKRSDKKHDYYLCNSIETRDSCQANLLKKIGYTNSDRVVMKMRWNAAAHFTGVDFVKTENSRRHYEQYGEQKLVEAGSENIIHMLNRPDPKPLLNERSNNQIKLFLNDVMLPQMWLWGYKDGMSDKEISEEIDSTLGKTLKDKIASIRTGEYNDWDPQ